MKKSILVILAVATMAAISAHAGDLYRAAPGAICKGMTLSDRFAINFTHGYTRNSSSYDINVICPVNFTGFNFWKELSIVTWAHSVNSPHVFKCTPVFRSSVWWFLGIAQYVNAGDGFMHWYNYFIDYRYRDAEHYIECTIPPQGEIQKIYWVENKT